MTLSFLNNFRKTKNKSFVNRFFDIGPNTGVFSRKSDQLRLDELDVLWILNDEGREQSNLTNHSIIFFVDCLK